MKITAREMAERAQDVRNRRVIKAVDAAKEALNGELEMIERAIQVAVDKDGSRSVTHKFAVSYVGDTATYREALTAGIVTACIEAGFEVTVDNQVLLRIKW